MAVTKTINFKINFSIRKSAKTHQIWMCVLSRQLDPHCRASFLLKFNDTSTTSTPFEMRRLYRLQIDLKNFKTSALAHREIREENIE